MVRPLYILSLPPNTRIKLLLRTTVTGDNKNKTTVWNQKVSKYTSIT